MEEVDEEEGQKEEMESEEDRAMEEDKEVKEEEGMEEDSSEPAESSTKNTGDDDKAGILKPWIGGGGRRGRGGH